MNGIVIKPLSAELIPDYLDFFDNRAFADGNPNGPCYCTSANQTQEEIRAMVSEFKDNGVKATVRKHAVQMLHAGKIRGYLAFDGDVSVAWCNAAERETYTGFVPDFAREDAVGRTVSIVCFEVAPGYRGKGIASMLIERVCEDAKRQGFAAVEGYAQVKAERDEFDFTGPVRLFEKNGFVQALQSGGQVVMRKVL